MADPAGAEWLYEAGIGEERAALIADDRVIEARIEADDRPVRAGAVFEARLTTLLPGKRTGIATLDGGEEVLLDPLAAGVAEGAAVRIEIVRPALPEAKRRKMARGRITDRAPCPAPSLKDALSRARIPVRETGAHEKDRLETAGWSEVIAEAASGEIGFPGGALQLALTPAMTVIDVDGALRPADLALAGATAAAQAIGRLDIGGSTVIDLPSLEERTARQAAAEAVDAALAPPFERTSVNGFGLLQIVRPRTRLSLPEMAQFEGPALAARQLLRAAERAQGHGARTLTAHPAVIARIETRPEWTEGLHRRTGTEIALAADPALGLWAGHVACADPG